MVGDDKFMPGFYPGKQKKKNPGPIIGPQFRGLVWLSLQPEFIYLS